MTERGAYVKAVVIIAVARLLLKLPDRVVARLIGFIGVLLRIVGAEAGVIQALAEVKVIFQSGPRATAIVRKMVSEGDPRRLRMIVRGSFLNAEGL